MPDAARRPSKLLFRSNKPDDMFAPVPSRRRLSRALRAVRRLLMVALWTVLAMCIQAMLVLLPDRFGLGRGKRAFARFYWGSLCWLIGMKVRVIGAPAHKTADGRPVIYVANHTSWLDILALGAQLDACFIAKAEVAGWPRSAGLPGWGARFSPVASAAKPRMSAMRCASGWRMAII